MRAAWLLLFLLSPALGYGYTAAEDPLLAAFRAALKAARAEDWSAAGQALADARWQVDELVDDLGVDLGPALDQTLADEDPRAFASAFANLVYLATLQKFHWNLSEQLADFDAARARLLSARAYYEQVLAGNVKRRDQADESALHEELIALFEDARQSLGSPGLFGVGAAEPDPAAFAAASEAIGAKLRRCFPSFVHPER